VCPQDHPQRPVDIRRSRLVHTLTSSTTLLRGVPRCGTQSRSGLRWARRDRRSGGVSGGSPAAARGHPSAASCPHAHVFDRVAATDAAGAAHSRAPVCGGRVGTDGARVCPEDHPQPPVDIRRPRLVHTLTPWNALLRGVRSGLGADVFGTGEQRQDASATMLRRVRSGFEPEVLSTGEQRQDASATRPGECVHCAPCRTAT
jgi:hypothetical protein